MHLVDGTREALWVIDAVTSTGERFGAAHIADLICGKTNDKAEQLQHTLRPCFGIGKERPRQYWQSMIRQMVGGGYLSLDVAGFGGLSVAPKGIALARGEGTFRYREDPVRTASRTSKKTVPVPDRTGVSDELLQRLKSLRAKLARQRSVPAYVIFSDRTLIDMAARRPLTRWDFGEVHGVGESKLQQFADIFLGELRDYVQAQAGVT